MHTSHPKKCEHKLVYCEQCNIVYCKTCGEEWKKEYSNYTWTYPGQMQGTGTLSNGVTGITTCCYHNNKTDL